MLLETNRLILRRYSDDDLDDLFEYLSDDAVVKFEPYRAMNLEETKENLKWRIETDEMIAVELKEKHKMIGNIYLGKRDFNSLEIGYVFNRAFWGKGYAKESCEAIVKYSFQKGIHRIFAECDPENVNSWKLLESLGFEKEAHLKQNIFFWNDAEGNPVWKDTLIYAVLN